ncbi:G9, partial [Linum perenne]
AWTDACASASPSKVVIPPGNYLAGVTKFAGPCKAPIELEINGIIKAPTTIKGDCWLSVEDVTDLKLFGTGTVDGQGAQCWASKGGDQTANLRFQNIKNGWVEGLTSKDSKFFHMATLNCNNMTFTHMNAIAPADSVNTDGIHISRSSGITVIDSTIGTGDDCVSMADNLDTITIQNVKCGPSHGISIGSLGKYEKELPVKNIFVRNCTIANSDNGIRIKSWPDRFATSCSGIHFEDITLDNVQNPIIIDQQYCPNGQCTSKTAASPVELSDITFKNVKGTSKTKEIIQLICSSAHPCQNVQMSDIDITFNGGPGVAICQNVKPVITGIMNPPIEVTPVGRLLTVVPAPALVGGGPGGVFDVMNPSKVVIPPGNYLAGVTKFAGPCKAPIELEINGIIKAPTAIKGDCWLSVEDVTNLKLFGTGTVDGQGAQCWASKGGDQTANLRFQNIKNGWVEGLTSKDSKFFHMATLNCNNMTFTHMNAIAPADSVNTDGIHISRSSGITVIDSIIGTGDDCVSMADNLDTITIQNVKCGPSHGISIGSLGKYEKELPVKNIFVRNCTIANSDNGIRIKSWPDRFATSCSGIHFEDITLDNVQNPIIIDQQYCPNGQCTSKTAASPVELSDITFKNVKGTSKTKEIIQLICSSAHPCQNVQMSDIDITFNGGPGVAICQNVKPVITGIMNPPIEVTPVGRLLTVVPAPALVGGGPGGVFDVMNPSKVVIPPGNYLAGVTKFAGPCKAPIELEINGIIKAPTAIKGDCWLSVEDVTDLKLFGTGTVDGQGAQCWASKGGDQTANLRFQNIKNGWVEGLTSKDSKFFHMATLNCNNMTFTHMNAIAPADSVNTDGIHISRSSGITVIDSIIGTGDDCVSMADNLDTITIQNVKCGPSHGISIGSLGKYEKELPVKNIFVRNCTIANSDNGIRIKSWPDKFATSCSGIHFEDITLDNVQNPIIIDQQYCPNGQCTSKTAASPVELSDITFKNVKGTSKTKEIIQLICSSAHPCQNVQMSDIDITFNGGPGVAICQNVKPVITGIMNPPIEVTPVGRLLTVVPAPALVGGGPGGVFDVMNPSKVVIPPGNYLAGVTKFAGPCKAPIELEINGIIKAPTAIKGDCWLSVEDVTDLKLFGTGTVDGQGAQCWASKGGDQTANLRFQNIKNGWVEGLTSKDSKFFHMATLNCNNMTFTHMSAIAPADSVNTDGIHISRSSGITVIDSIIGTGDDCVSMADNLDTITIQNVKCGPSHGISIGSLGKYEKELPVKNIFVRNCTIANSDNGIRIKSWPDRFATSCSGIHFEDITLDNVQNPIIIDQQYCPNGQCTSKTAASPVELSDITFKNVKGTSKTKEIIQLICSSAHPCQNVQMSDIDITFNGGPGVAICQNVKPVITGIMNPPIEVTPVGRLLTVVPAPALAGGGPGGVFDVMNPSKVVIPPGNYLAGVTKFAGPCKAPIELEINGIIKAPTAIKGDCWLSVEDVTDLKLFGTGTVDGQGAQCWASKGGDQTANLRFQNIKNGWVEGLTSKDSKFFHMATLNCNNMTFTHMNAIAPADSVNTDGIHISRSSGITVIDSIIGTGDDCVSMADNLDTITIQNVKCGPSHGISIGSLGKYEKELPVKNIFVRHCTIANSDNGIRIKSWPDRFATSCSGIHFEDITLDNVQNPIIIDQQYCPNGQCTSKTAASPVELSDITFKNVKGTSKTKEIIQLICSSAHPCQNVQMSDIDITFNGGPGVAICQNVKPVITGIMNPPIEVTPVGRLLTVVPAPAPAGGGPDGVFDVMNPSKVVIPPGNYLAGVTKFAGPCKAPIELEINGIIKAPTAIKGDCWLSVEDVTDLKLFGTGTVDGQGAQCWASKGGDQTANLRFQNIKNGWVEGLTSKDSKFFHMATLNCNNMTFTHMNAIAPADSVNTDGIHISRSSGITVIDSTIGTGDDCVSMADNLDTITIQNVKCGPSHGISIGSLGKYEKELPVKNIFVRHCTIANSDNGIRIKSWPDRFSTSCSGIHFEDITLDNVQNPIIIDQQYCPNGQCTSKTAASPVELSDITFKNVKGTSKTKEIIQLICSSAHPCQNVQMSDIDITFNGGPGLAICQNVKPVITGIMNPPGC